jgi:hypothetical protein
MATPSPACARQSVGPAAADVQPRLGLILLVALLASGCAAPNPTGTAEPSVTAGVTPLPTIDERGLAAGKLTCGNGDTFSAAALQGPGAAETGPDGAAAGLRAVLAERGDPQIPLTGWHLVELTDAHAQFVARGLAGSQWVVVALDRNDDGWTIDLAGQCHLSVVLGPGINPAPWWLDPTAGDLVATQTTLDVLVQESACAGGRPPDGRIVPPVVVYQADALVIAFGTIPLPGAQDCVGAPPAKYRIALREPLGDRRLLDGGTIPPRDATKPPA